MKLNYIHTFYDITLMGLKKVDLFKYISNSIDCLKLQLIFIMSLVMISKVKEYSFSFELFDQIFDHFNSLQLAFGVFHIL